MITSAIYLKSEVINETTFRATVRLVDSVTGTYDHGFIVTGSSVAELRDDITRQIVDLNTKAAAKVVLDGIASGANIPVTLPVPAAPTAFQTWLIAAQKWQSVKQLLIDTGIKTGAESEILALKTAATNGYDPTYLANF